MATSNLSILNLNSDVVMSEENPTIKVENLYPTGELIATIATTPGVEQNIYSLTSDFRQTVFYKRNESISQQDLDKYGYVLGLLSIDNDRLSVIELKKSDTKSAILSNNLVFSGNYTFGAIKPTTATATITATAAAPKSLFDVLSSIFTGQEYHDTWYYGYTLEATPKIDELTEDWILENLTATEGFLNSPKTIDVNETGSLLYNVYLAVPAAIGLKYTDVNFYTVIGAEETAHDKEPFQTMTINGIQYTIIGSNPDGPATIQSDQKLKFKVTKT